MGSYRRSPRVRAAPVPCQALPPSRLILPGDLIVFPTCLHPSTRNQTRAATRIRACIATRIFTPVATPFATRFATWNATFPQFSTMFVRASRLDRKSFDGKEIRIECKPPVGAECGKMWKTGSCSRARRRAPALPFLLLPQSSQDAQVLERGGVLRGGFAAGDVAQEAAHDFSGAGFGQRVGEADFV